MTVVYTNARALMAVEATTLAAEATTAGLTNLATALTNLATEITTNNGVGGATDADFYGNSGLFQIYSQTLIAAANIVKSRIGNNIKADLDSIVTNLGTLNTNVASQTTAITGLKSDLDTLASNSTTMLGLAQGTGIHFVGPYDWLGFASIYHLYVEQGKLLDQSGNASPDQQAAALTQLQSYLTKVKNLPTLF
jgi:hypothetical protein